MTLHQLRVFVTVAKLGSFTETGKLLHTGQSSVSALIADLVIELNAKLFQRQGLKRVKLTDAGEVLYKTAQEVLDKIDRVPEAIGQVLGLKAGRLMVGCTAVGGATFLPEAVEKFREGYPGVNLILRTDRSSNLEKKLLAGDLDLAILGRAPRSSLLIGDPFLEEPMVIVEPLNRPLKRKRVASLDSIAHQPFITYERGIWPRDLLEKTLAERGLRLKVKLEFNMDFGSTEAIRNAVSQGLGIALLPKCQVASDCKIGRLRILNVPELNLIRTLYIVVSKHRKGWGLAQAFRNHLLHYKDRQ